jgi:citronellol/citronellal dehydrogenase
MRAATFILQVNAIAYLERAQNPHILMLSPPLDMAEKWFAPYTGYTMAKFGMSMVVFGLAGELRPKGIAVNALWPRTTIATAAIKNLLGGDAIMRSSRTPDILADAAYLIFTKPASSFTGQFLIDDTFLAGEGVTDFDAYRVDPNQPLSPDFFVTDSSKPPPCVSLAVAHVPAAIRGERLSMLERGVGSMSGDGKRSVAAWPPLRKSGGPKCCDAQRGSGARLK